MPGQSAVLGPLQNMGGLVKNENDHTYRVYSLQFLTLQQLYTLYSRVMGISVFL